MGAVEVTTLHAVGIGETELSPSLDDEPSSLGASSRVACSDGDPLWSMPLTMTLELSPSGNKRKLLRWLVMNTRSLKQMAWSRMSSMPNKEMLSVAAAGLHRWNYRNV
jgi:hypothetical protein